MQRQIYNFKTDKYLFKQSSEIWINSFIGPLKTWKERPLHGQSEGDLFKRKKGIKF